MAELCGVYAASHTPVMLNFPDAISDAERTEIFAAFTELGRTIAAARPDVLIVLVDDHLHNFFLNNFPAFCIGSAETYASPAEHWLRAEKRVLRGHAALGAHILTYALQHDFDPSFSMELTLDHGVLTPLELAGVERELAIVPILFNCVQPPMPTMQRCYAFGRALGDAVRAFPGDERIAILASGGLSHDLATPRMGMVNEAFDRTLLERLAAGDGAGAVAYGNDHVHEAGNGAEEIRMWLAAHAAAGGGAFVPSYYRAVEKWYTGIGMGAWQLP